MSLRSLDLEVRWVQAGTSTISKFSTNENETLKSLLRHSLTMKLTSHRISNSIGRPLGIWASKGERRWVGASLKSLPGMFCRILGCHQIVLIWACNQCVQGFSQILSSSLESDCLEDMFEVLNCLSTRFLTKH